MIWAPREAYDINQINDDEMGGECLKHGERRHARRVLVVKPEVQKPLSRPGREWESYSKMNLIEKGRKGGMQKVDSSGMEKVQMAVFFAYKVMNPRVQ